MTKFDARPLLKLGEHPVAAHYAARARRSAAISRRDAGQYPGGNLRNRVEMPS